MNSKKIIRHLVLTAFLAFGSHQTAWASGDFFNFWAKPNAQCERASRPESALRSGAACRFTVNFSYSACPNGTALNTCATDRPVHYWLEQRLRNSNSWRRITDKKVFDFSNVNESIEIKPTQSLNYRVAFEYYGQEAFADDYSRTFTINVKGR